MPIIQKPNELNPEKGFIATANQNVTPNEYDNWNAIGYSWSDPYRGDRVNEVLAKNDQLNREDMKNLQVDVTSLPAKILIPFLEEIDFEEFVTEQKNRLLNWDFLLESSSIEAAIYVEWENEIKRMAHKQFVPEIAKPYITTLQLKRVIDWIENPKETYFGSISRRDTFLKVTFEEGVSNLKKRLGPDTQEWRYGQTKFKHSFMEHALGGHWY